MTSDPPINFEEKVRQPAKSAGGAPLQISATDLMKNFAFATLVLPDSLVDQATGINGHTTRKLKGPQSGTYVLGCVDGEIQWLETESC
jgi:hypothetical protein